MSKKNIDRESAKQEIAMINKKISVYITSMIFMLLISLTLGMSYAVYQLDTEQEESNQVSVGCFTIQFEDSGTSNTYTNLSLTNSYPISTQTALTKTPYTFKVTNTCDYIARANIAINVLKTSSVSSLATQQGKEIGDMIVTAIKEGNGSVSTPVQLSSLEEGTIRSGDTETDVSYILRTEYLEKNDPKTYSIWMWVPEEINGVEVGNESQSLTLYSKIDIYTQAISGTQTVTDTNVVYIPDGQQSQLKNLSITGGTENNINVGQDGTIDIVVSGKNLFNYNWLSDRYNNGLTYTNNNNGCYTVTGSWNGTGSGNSRAPFSHNESLNIFSTPGNYVLSVSNNSDDLLNKNEPHLFMNFYYNSSWDRVFTSVTDTNSKVYNLTQEKMSDSEFIIQTGLWIDANNYVSGKEICPQIEYGSSKTSFEPYKERRYTIELKDINGNTINGLGNNDTLKKVTGTWVIDSGSTQTTLANTTQNALNNINIYEGVSRVWVDDPVLISNISVTYLS